MSANFPKNETERIENGILQEIAVLERAEYDKVYALHPDLKKRLLDLKARVHTASDRAGLLHELSRLTEGVDMIG